MTGCSSIWNSRGKLFAHRALEKSALIVVVEFCSEVGIAYLDIRAIIPAYFCRSSIFHLTGRSSDRLAQAIGIEPDLWDQARGTDLLAGRRGIQTFVAELRYCPICLERGNHSMLFQLPQIARCPVHHAPLQMGCPHCGRFLSTTPESLARNHLHCGSCNRNLATMRRKMALGGADAHPDASSFAELRKAAAGTLEPGESRSPVQLDVVPSHTARSPTLARMLHTQTIWRDSPLIGGFQEWKSASFNLPSEGPKPEPRQVFVQARIAAIQALKDLATQLEALQVQLGEMTFDLGGVTRSAGRFDLKVSAVSAAFWQTAMVFDVHRFLNGQSPPTVARGPHFASWLPGHVGAMYKVINQAVLELFALYVVRNRRLTFGVQIAWADSPYKASYLVPWRIRPTTAEGVNLQIRFRVTSETVRRLASRYKDHWLLVMPADVRPLEVINQRTS